VGDKGYVDEVKQNLLSRAVGRKTDEWEEGVFEIREPVVSYNPVLDPQNSLLSLENSVI
jgi:preprotein translocase subunit SecA